MVNCTSKNHNILIEDSARTMEIPYGSKIQIFVMNSKKGQQNTVLYSVVKTAAAEKMQNTGKMLIIF